MKRIFVHWLYTPYARIRVILREFRFFSTALLVMRPLSDKTPAMPDGTRTDTPLKVEADSNTRSSRCPQPVRVGDSREFARTLRELAQTRK